FEDFDENTDYVTRSRTVTEADVVNFAGLSGDFNPLHTDAEFMKNSQFGQRIAHGMLVASIATGQINQMGWFEGTTLALLEITFRFTAPVLFGQTVRTRLKVTEKKPTSKPERGVVVMDVIVENEKGEPVIKGTQSALMKTRAGG